MTGEGCRVTPESDGRSESLPTRRAGAGRELFPGDLGRGGPGAWGGQGRAWGAESRRAEGRPGSDRDGEERLGHVGASALDLGPGMCHPECTLAWQVPKAIVSGATGLSSS